MKSLQIFLPGVMNAQGEYYFDTEYDCLMMVRFLMVNHLFRPEDSQDIMNLSSEAVIMQLDETNLIIEEMEEWSCITFHYPDDIHQAASNVKRDAKGEAFKRSQEECTHWAWGPKLTKHGVN